MGREEKDLTVVSRDVKSAVVISSASMVRLLVMLQEMEEEEEERGILGPSTVSTLTHKVKRKQIVANNKSCLTYILRYGLVVRISGSHPGGPGSIPGNGNHLFLFPFDRI